MFVLRCLNTLLLGYTVLVRGAPSWTSSDTTLRLARSLSYDWNDSDSEHSVEDNHAGSNTPTEVPVTPVRLYNGRESVQAAAARKGRRRPRQDQDLSPPDNPLEDKNGSSSACTDCLPNVSGISTVFLTKPTTRTVTAVIGPPITSLVISTETDTLTFLNPGLQIQTSIITVTSFFNRERRTAVLPAESSAGRPIPGGSLNGRGDLVITSTIEEVSVVTKTTQSTVFATRTNTVFQTVTIAESASSTVFSTTTVFTTSPKSETSVAVSRTTTGTEPLTTVSSLQSSSVTGLTSVSVTGSSSRATTIGLPPSSTSLVSSETTIMSVSSLTSSLSVSIGTSETATSQTTTVRTIQSASSTGGVPLPFPPATPAPTATLVPGSSLPGPGLNSSQIAGIVLGGVSGLFLISLALFALRWCIRRRRSRLAELRQQISDPSMAAGATAAGARGLGSPDGSVKSALTGEGEVRIVIRPARSQTWPMPPGHAGQTYSLFIEETTTGETSPAADPETWSNASDSGSVMNIPRKPILSASGPGTTESRSRGSSSGERSAFAGGRPVPGTAGAGAAAGGTTTYRGPAEQSLVSVGWGTSVGGRSDFSGAGVTTNLSPPPAAVSNDRTGSRSGPRRWEDPGSWGYPGSWGIGKAL